MKKLTVAALAAWVFALVPMYAFALAPMDAYGSSDRDEIDEACRQAAVDEGVPAEESADFIADCIAANFRGDEGEGAESAEDPGSPSE